MRRIIMLVPALLALLLAGCFVIKVNLGPEREPFEEQVIGGSGRDKVLLMDITGVITSEAASTVLGAAKKPGIVAVLREQLDQARTDRDIKAVVIRINSPGGGVTASDTLYHEIRKFRDETGVKVVAHFMDTGASGAYYAALAADRITAQPTTITGSIGVTMIRVDATGLLQKIGVQAMEISSGPEKAMGSPFRTMGPEEKKIFQGLIDDLYGRFVTVVAEGRNMPAERVRRIADGRIYSSREAKELGLIDEIGYLDDALAAAGKLAELEQATIITYVRPGQYRPNMYSSLYSLNINLSDPLLGDLAGPGMQFTYLWMP
jgi:protease-4